MAVPDGLHIDERLQGLFYFGRVSAVPGPNQITVPAFANLPAGGFVGANPYSISVVSDAGGLGAAPEGEVQPLTAYQNDGTVTTAAFTAPAAVGDYVLLIHPALGIPFGLGGIAAQIAKLAGVAPVSSFVVANWQAAEQTLVNIGAAATRNKVHSLMINIAATGGAITIRMKHIVNGVLTTVYNQTFTAAVDGPGRWTINGTVGIFDVLQVTCQSNLAGDNGVAISYSYMMEAM